VERTTPGTMDLTLTPMHHVNAGAALFALVVAEIPRNRKAAN